jgi:CDP-diacylglycerol---glycerol-3-phosphate 3-phosphatidyltransferase
MKINLPNQITLARLFMAIVFFVCLAQYDVRDAPAGKWLLNLSAILFVVAALTDVLDGYLARKHNQVTSFGRVIDPVVDKILIIGAYTFLAGEGFVTAAGESVSDVTAWMVVVILGRELLVTSLRGAMEGAGDSFAANVYGKLKMFIQSFTVVWVLLSVSYGDTLAFGVVFRPVVVYLMVGVTFLSMIPYVIAARSVLAQTSVPAR